VKENVFASHVYSQRHPCGERVCLEKKCLFSEIISNFFSQILPKYVLANVFLLKGESGTILE
jgi:hypothetical protein